MPKIKKLKVVKNKIKLKQEQMKAKLANYLIRGIDLEDACKLAGCGRELLGVLRSDFEFEDFVQKCYAENESSYLEAIEKASKLGYWQAAAWFLERRFPDKYARRDIIKHEYEIKLNTFKEVILKVIGEVAPEIKHKIIYALRNYQYNGEMVANSTEFKVLDPPKDGDVFDLEEE